MLVNIKLVQPNSSHTRTGNVSPFDSCSCVSIPANQITQGRETNSQPSFGPFKPSTHIFNEPVLPCTPSEHHYDGFWRYPTLMAGLWIDGCASANLILMSATERGFFIPKQTLDLAYVHLEKPLFQLMRHSHVPTRLSYHTY